MKTAINLKQKVSTLTSVLCGTLLGFTAVSCADKDFDWEAAKATNPEYSFKKNFELRYGPIDPNQSWDFTTNRGPLTRGTRAAEEEEEGVAPSENYLEVYQGTLDWMEGYLIESRNNSELGVGSSFSFMTQGQDFSIMPIFMGNADLQWQLRMEANYGGEVKDVKVWFKGEGMRQLQLSSWGRDKSIFQITNSGKSLSYSSALDKLVFDETEGDHFIVIRSYKYGDKQYLYDLDQSKFAKLSIDSENGGTHNTSGNVISLTDNMEEASSLKIENRTVGDETIQLIELSNTSFNAELFAIQYDAENGVTSRFPGWINSSAYVTYNSEIVDFDNTSEVYNVPAIIVEHDDDWGWWSNLSESSNTLNAHKIQSKYFIFSKDDYPLGTELRFYLKITNKHPGYYDSTNEEQWSTDNMMLTMQLPEGAIPDEDHIPAIFRDEDYEAAIIGCEDNNVGDWDYNDVVFLMLGKTIPVPMKYIAKRYMVEDLGTTDDLDFNDVVVDIEQQAYLTIDRNASGKLVYVEDTSRTPLTKATVRAMGGTLDFEFGFTKEEGGKKVFKSMFRKGNLLDLNYAVMYNTAENNIDESEIYFEGPTTLWEPANNNVAFKVYKDVDDVSGTLNLGTNDRNIVYDNDNERVSSYTLTFPSPGDTPYIMAFPLTKKWKYERKQICRDWVLGLFEGQGVHEGCNYQYNIVDF